jgi:integrase/recombinase XerD
MTPDDTESALASWLRHLRAERKSPNTLKVYGDGVRGYIGYCRDNGLDCALDRDQMAAFISFLLDSGGRRGEGASAATARSRFVTTKRFSAWLTAEGITDVDLLLAANPPKLDEKIVPELSGAQIKALIKTCGTGGRRPFCDVRDEALIRFMLETLARASEALIGKADLNLDEGMAIIRRGKGGKGRRVPFGPQTAVALDRYLRLRGKHPLAQTPPLWLGDRARGFTYWGLYSTLVRRAEQAGIPADDFHPHVLRHTGAGRWLDAGGSEGGLLAVGGWHKREMIDRYTKATSERRAAEESRALNLGDF